MLKIFRIFYFSKSNKYKSSVKFKYPKHRNYIWNTYDKCHINNLLTHFFKDFFKLDLKKLKIEKKIEAYYTNIIKRCFKNFIKNISSNDINYYYPL